MVVRVRGYTAKNHRGWHGSRKCVEYKMVYSPALGKRVKRCARYRKGR